MAINPYTADLTSTTTSIIAPQIDFSSVYKQLSATLGNSTFYGVGSPTLATNIPLVDLTKYKWYIDIANGNIYFYNSSWSIIGTVAVGTTGGGTTIGISDKNNIYNQTTPSASALITHGLNKIPAVTLIDSSGNQITGRVQHTNLNICLISFDTVPFIWSASFN